MLKNCLFIKFIFILEGRDVKDVALGSEHTICLATDNTLWAWGWNEHANTGTGGEEYIFQPTRVYIGGIGEAVITQVYAGGAHNFIYTNGKDVSFDSQCDS